jgi:hypothetical protein
VVEEVENRRETRLNSLSQVPQLRRISKDFRSNLSQTNGGLQEKYTQEKRYVLRLGAKNYIEINKERLRAFLQKVARFVNSVRENAREFRSCK